MSEADKLDKEVETVVRQYSWRGDLQSYHYGDTWVPFDTRNSTFQRIRAGLVAGSFREIEPTFTRAIRVFGEDGQLTGYDTNLGFVPNDPANQFFKLLENALLSGGCSTEDPPAPDDILPLKDIVIYVFLDRPWPNVSGSYQGEFPYSSGPNLDPIRLRVRVRNIPEQGGISAFSLLAELQEFSTLKDFGGSLIRIGILEIEVPSAFLLKLFRRERRRLAESHQSYLEDSLAQHLVRTGRSSSRGPTTRWLALSSPEWLGRMVSSLGDIVGRTLMLDVGGAIPTPVSENILLSGTSIIVAHDIASSATLYHVRTERPDYFSLEGTWSAQYGAIREVLEPGLNPMGHRKYMRQRIRQMIKAGFGVEALAPLNAFIEVSVRDALTSPIIPHAEAVVKLHSMSHRRRLSVVRRLVDSPLDPTLSEIGGPSLVEAMMEIYRHRNDYLHDLRLPGRELWLSVEGRRRIEGYAREFADLGGSKKFDTLLIRIWHATSPFREFILRAVEEA